MESLVYIVILLVTMSLIIGAVIYDCFTHEDKLGVVQKAWIKSLKNHPERQTIGALNSVLNDDSQSFSDDQSITIMNNCAKGITNYKACCLGEGLLTLLREGVILKGLYNHSNNASPAIPDANALGLFTPRGSITNNEKLFYNGDCYVSLMDANDNGVPWSIIADFMYNKPEAVFAHKA